MKIKRIFVVIIAIVQLSGCASMISSATKEMADNLSSAIQSQNDLETVKAGAPAFLIMIDSLIEGDPENPSLLMSGANLYALYTSAFVDNEERSRRLSEKSMHYARRAMCPEIPSLCRSLEGSPDQLQTELNRLTLKQQPLLYAFASAWAGWIQVNADDWNAMAQLPKLTAMFSRSLELDETYDGGGAHLYLGVLSSQIPPQAGGKPEQGRLHFEKALALSGGKNLMVNVLFAEHYARLVFDQPLHDRLLSEVLAAEAQTPGLTLVNTVAKSRASELLKESADFF